MSSQYLLYSNGMIDLEIDERSARYDLDIDHQDITLSIPSLEAKEVLGIALGMFYAVWCSYPDLAEAMAADMSNDLCGTWNRQQRGHKV
jgi:hypothetical protein